MEPVERSAERLVLAQDFLREAVYRSRARQAASSALAPSEAVDGERSAALGNCGLGAKAAVVLDLDARGRDLFARLFGGDDLPGPALERVHAAMTDWIRRQDALDRKRNHFLKAFRNEHGVDRRTYGAEPLAEFEAGLAEVNAQCDRELDEAAQALLAHAGA
jgi:hypothetical protein